MTVSTTSARVSYAGNGVTVAFAIPWRFLADGDIAAYLVDAAGLPSALTLSTHYTLAGADDPAGGVLTMLTAPASGQTLTIIRDPAQTQLVDYVSNDTFPAETHERALDRLTMIVQRLADRIGRALRLSDADPVSSASAELTSKANRKGKFLYFNATTGAPEVASFDGNGTVLTAAVIGGFIYPVSDAETTAGVTPTALEQPYGWVTRYGAVGDGVTDDLAAINACARVAAAGGGLVYFPPGYTFAIDGYVEILNGTRLVTGRGTILCLNNGNTAPSGVMLKGTAHGAAANVANCRVEGLRIDRNGQWSFGIYAENVAEVQIVGNEIINGTGVIANNYAAILCPTTDEAEAAPHDVLISGNYIENETSTSVVGGHDGIQVAGAYSLGLYASLPAKWKATFEPATTVSACYNIEISDNVVVGGYYGISVVETRYSSITGNQCHSNIRGIVQQSNCYSNLIASNLVRECNSSGVMGGYGVYDCLIEGNRIYSTRAQGEGLLQLYVGADRNVIENNYTFATGLSPNHHIYVAVHANNNAIRNNVLGGTCGKAYIGLESAWDKDVAVAAHYAYGFAGTDFEDFADSASTGNTIAGNLVQGVSAVPVLWLGQVNSNATVCALTNTTVVGNEIRGNGYTYQLRLYEDNSGSLSGVVLRDNAFDVAATPASFLFPRGRAHCSMCLGNAVLNAGSASVPFQTFTDADTTPSVAGADAWQCANTGATSITMFDDGADGQTITIRGDANTTLVHNASNIRLKGATNAVFSSVYEVLTLKRLGGVWLEMTRNF